MLPIIRFVVAIGLSFFVLSEVLSDVHSAGDASAGKLKSTACSGCHGADGNSPGPLQPNLAGQDAGYIVHQIKAFKDGARQNSTMIAIAAGLSEVDMAGLAAYFAGQTPKSAGGDALLAKKGQPNYNACWGCHGQNGRGQEGYPKLAGQHPEYIVQQLNNFKNGSRKNPAMKGITANLSDADLDALGAYLGSLNPN